jgi:hypothetical protein
MLALWISDVDFDKVGVVMNGLRPCESAQLLLWTNLTDQELFD